FEEARSVVAQGGFCEGEAHNGAWWNSVTLPRPKGGSKQGTQSTPKHWRSPLYSTRKAKTASAVVSPPTRGHHVNAQENQHRVSVVSLHPWQSPAFYRPSRPAAGGRVYVPGAVRCTCRAS